MADLDTEDLRWLVGHLLANKPPGHKVFFPPRLQGLLVACADGYDPGRFTLAAVYPPEPCPEGHQCCAGRPEGHDHDGLDPSDCPACGYPDPDPAAPVVHEKVTDLMAALEESVREAKAARARHPRWCAYHRDGWCAVAGNEEPAEGSYQVPTVCGWFVVLPGGFDRRVPDCPECLTALADPRPAAPAGGEEETDG